jgi:heme-degrading monooxygenase HmoA
MFMRLVNLKVKEGRMNDFARAYEERIIPALQGVKGCLYASLLKPRGDDVECVSMTMWRTREDVEAYERSGLYDELLDEMDEMMAEVVELKVRSGASSKREIPLLQDPDVEAFPVEVAGIREIVDADVSRHFFVRLVSARIKMGKFEALKERFDKEIKPALMATKGCRAVFLVENTKTQERALSVTVWDSEDDAIRYEISGGFDEQTAKVSEFFSGLYQWRISLRGSEDRRSISGKDLDVKGFQVVTGKRMGS